MFLRSLTQPVNKYVNIKQVTVSRLERLGIKNAADLLAFYPRDWEDRSLTAPIKNFAAGKVNTVATVTAKNYFLFKNKRTPKIHIKDETGSAVLVCYNRPWDDDKFITGAQYRIFGSFKYDRGKIQSSNFDFEPLEKSEFDGGFNSDFNRIMPIYALTSGLTQSALRILTYKVIKKVFLQLDDELPQQVMEKHALLTKKEAIKQIHFPDSFETLKAAKKTLIYEELFYLQIIVGKRSIERRSASFIASAPGSLTPIQKRLTERLPFSLTKGQIDAVHEINSDILSPAPMARLLQGDVGSGKTLVSFFAALLAAENTGQCAIMAPTELLARQHAENAAKILEPLGLNIAFLTGNIKAAGRKTLLKNLKEGTIHIVVGTHALFSKDVIYKNLKLVVIDEQHRFGVTQRALIMTKGEAPNLLMMSATPIPRSLALTVFGDMDVSIIRDMPPGRLPVKTHIAKETNEKKVYDFILGELQKGRQAYFVYPLIEESETVTELKNAQEMAHRLSNEIFPEYKTELIHSKLAEDEKKQIMDDFRKGKINILAATSVVEVGVDVPNATCMIIEHAERFGLSALHQLRGRVGRGKDQSYCFLTYSDNLTEDAKKRLKIVYENNDGFIIAEEDLKLRGPGQITGTQQSGYIILGIANPIRDIDELEKAREDAFGILENDPDLLLEETRVVANVLHEAPPFLAFW